MRKLLPLTFFLIFTLTVFGQTQTELTKASSEKYSKAYTELQKVYSEIENDYKNDTLFLSKLKTSQEIWLKFIAAEIEMKYPKPNKNNYGSMYSMCANGYLEKMTNERTKKLMEWLLPIPKGEVCVGSVKYRKANGETYQ